MELKFHLNGTPMNIDIGDPDTPIVFVLREHLNLKGTKFGCLEGLCGACTIHVDGVATRSCQAPASDMDGAEITTIEGLPKDASHPVQQAWMEMRVPQCGYCQSGQIMQAVAFLSEEPEPERQDIVDAMSGNLCRCGTGPRIHDAVELAAKLAREG